MLRGAFRSRAFVFPLKRAHDITAISVTALYVWTVARRGPRSVRQPVSLERGRASSLRVEIQRRRCRTTPGDVEESSRVACFSSDRRLVGGTRALSEQHCSSGHTQKTWGNARVLSSVCSQGKPPVLRKCFAHSTALRRPFDSARVWGAPPVYRNCEESEFWAERTFCRLPLQRNARRGDAKRQHPSAVAITNQYQLKAQFTVLLETKDVVVLQPSPSSWHLPSPATCNSNGCLTPCFCRKKPANAKACLAGGAK